MNCEKFGAYEMGELSAQEFKLHLSQCSFCREQAELDARLEAALPALREAAPAPRLWERIEAGLQEEIRTTPGPRPAGEGFALGRFFKQRFIAITAAALFLAAVGLGIFFALKPVPSASGLLARKALENIESKEGEYVQAIQDLEKIARPHMAEMDLEMMSLYRDRLAAIDAQIERCREALSANPANAHIRRYMLAALKDKQDTLAELLEDRD